MKECKKCKEQKELTEFGNKKTNKDGLQSTCKKCEAIRIRNYYKTKEGKLKKCYDDQVSSSKRRGHEPPYYTKQQFVDRFIDNLDFERHYYSWVISNYSKKYSPSFDRLDDYKGYSFDNLQIMYWCHNKAKGHLDRKNGVNNKHSKAVIGTCTKTGNIIEFYSANKAGRHGFNQGHVSSCCRGEIRQHKGYKWTYKN